MPKRAPRAVKNKNEHSACFQHPSIHQPRAATAEKACNGRTEHGPAQDYVGKADVKSDQSVTVGARIP